MAPQEQESYALVYQELSERFYKIRKDTPELICKDLIAFLQDAAKKHHCFHHFTSFDALKQILKNRRWKFGSALKCNDLQEINEKGDCSLWPCIFSLSFSHGDEDNMGMWNMYGDNKNKAKKVCITIDQETLFRWKEQIENGSISCYWYPAKNKLIKMTESNRKVLLHDIVYAYGYQNSSFSVLHWGNNVLALNGGKDILNPSEYKELTGFIKNSAWEYEQETRLSLLIGKVETGKDVFVEVPDYVLQNMRLRVGPYFTPPSLQSQLQDELGEFSNDCRNAIIGNIDLSYFNGRIN